MSNSYEYIKLNNIKSLSQNFNNEDSGQLPLRADYTSLTKDEKAMKTNNTQDNQNKNQYLFEKLDSDYLKNKEWNTNLNKSLYQDCNKEGLNDFPYSKNDNNKEEDGDNDNNNNVDMINKIYSNVGKWLQYIDQEYLNNDDNIKQSSDVNGKSLRALVRDLEVSMNTLQRILNNNRYPLIALIGRRGSGKSSCINAIVGQCIAKPGHIKSQTGQAKILLYRDNNGSGIDVLDTRGINEGERPEENDVSNTAVDSIVNALKQVPVDCILYLHKAKELDSGIESDLKVLNEIIVKCNFKTKIPIIGVITQCDELEPSDIIKPSEYDEEKLENIAKAKEVLKSQLKKYAPDLNDYVIGVEAISSYIRWNKKPDENGAILPMRDYRYNIDKLMDLLMNNVNIKALFKTAQVCKIQNIKINFANMLVNIFATVTAAISSLPLPVIDVAVLSSIDKWMINTIANLGNNKCTQSYIGKFLSMLCLGTNGFLRFSSYHVISCTNYNPVVGTCMRSAFSSSLTYLIGKAAIAYFIEHKKNDEIVKNKIKEVYSFINNGSSDEKVPMDSQFIEDINEVSKNN